MTLIDGFVVRSVEEGALSIEEARREAYGLLELLLAAPAQMPQAVESLRSQAAARLA